MVTRDTRKSRYILKYIVAGNKMMSSRSEYLPDTHGIASLLMDMSLPGDAPLAA